MTETQRNLVVISACTVAFTAAVYVTAMVLFAFGVKPHVAKVEIENHSGQKIDCAYTAVVPALDCNWGHPR